MLPFAETIISKDRVLSVVPVVYRCTMCVIGGGEGSATCAGVGG